MTIGWETSLDCLGTADPHIRKQTGTANAAWCGSLPRKKQKKKKKTTETKAQVRSLPPNPHSACCRSRTPKNILLFVGSNAPPFKQNEHRLRVAPSTSDSAFGLPFEQHHPRRKTHFRLICCQLPPCLRWPAWPTKEHDRVGHCPRGTE